MSEGKTQSAQDAGLQAGGSQADPAQPHGTSGIDRPAGVEGLHLVPDFTFENGEHMPELRVGYVSYGTLNAARDNLLLVLPGTSNTRFSSLEHIGPGRAYDTDRYYVVCTDAIGGGSSSQPADGLGGSFPRYSIRDMVRAQLHLVEQGLGLGPSGRIAVLAGASMGAFQTLEWLIQYPGSVDKAVLLVPATRGGRLFRVTTARMFELIRLDRRWQDGGYDEQPLDGLRAAGRHYYPWTVSDAYIELHEPVELDQEIERMGEGFAKWDAWSITRRYEASTAHDIGVPWGGDIAAALARVKARVLVLPCKQDRLLGVEGARQIAAGIAGSVYSEVDSWKGHTAWRPEPGSLQTQFVTKEIRQFLGLPVAA
jgi:homoserine O-acetyltransferase